MPYQYAKLQAQHSSVNGMSKQYGCTSRTYAWKETSDACFRIGTRPPGIISKLDVAESVALGEADFVILIGHI